MATGCESAGPPDTSPGVSRALASYRAGVLSDLRYDVHLTIPDSLSERIRGYETVRFQLSDASRPLVIDFHQPRESVVSVRAGGREIGFDVVNDHIVLPAAALDAGANAVEIEFTAGENSLNRNRDFLYTLFVPDRARFAIPCFDQPDLKARFTLRLDVPASWQAVANGGLESYETTGERSVFEFAETMPISTYLFSFAAGEFQVVSAERGGREMRMYHRETDTTRVARNLEAIFDLHETALDWLEEYTGIEYPFGKFDFVLIPAFQYNGMEHPGAILYRSSSLFLDESATQNDRLRRASLIAHETSHMWFGDLVTMEWFNDVWMKEVFANFMAAKIVNPSFPDIDHELRFLLAHYPAAYNVDRTAGANPIRQQLDNLAEAGTLYGAIIYQKAPIVMKHLEELIGEKNLRNGLREYLRAFEYANATWPDLIEILGARTEDDLASWSHVWVEEAGRPTITVSKKLDDRGNISSLVVSQWDPEEKGRIWNQRLSVMLAYPHTSRLLPIQLKSASAEVAHAKYLPAPDFVLPNGKGVAYGLFDPDQNTLDDLLENAPSPPDPLTRGIVWLTLWDAMLEGRVPPGKLVDLAAAALAAETDELLVQRVLAYLQAAYWRYLPRVERDDRAAGLESLLWDLMEGATTPSLKASYFNTFRSIVLTDPGVRRLEEIWRGDAEIAGLPLSERDHTRIAQDLAIREVEGWERILDEQEERIANPDRKQRFAFVRPALSANPSVRDLFFESLKQPVNREHEPWVLEGVRYLNHPLRAAASEKYILPSLEMLEEIQATGDIFFPKNWLDATLWGQNSESAAALVRRFLEQHPGYPARLRGKILQSADGLFRSARILAGTGSGPA
jgi:aminopeptidase N